MLVDSLQLRNTPELCGHRFKRFSTRRISYSSDLEWSQLTQSAEDSLKSKKHLNDLNFNLILGGYRYDGGSFNDINESSFWWSNTEYYKT